MKRKILIVEDNVGLSQMQKDWFSQAGYDAVTAMNETIARSLIRRTQFDLILSDVRLPEGDGISLLEWLRKERKDIPFILTTYNPQNETCNAPRTNGAKIKTKRETETKRSVPSVRFFCAPAGGVI